MDYLAILKTLDSTKSESDTAATGTAVAGPPYELNELNELSPACPGPDVCAGCYSVGVIDGRERFIHPPKASADWQAWLKRWQPRGRTQ